MADSHPGPIPHGSEKLSQMERDAREYISHAPVGLWVQVLYSRVDGSICSSRSRETLRVPGTLQQYRAPSCSCKGLTSCVCVHGNHRS